MESTTHSNLSPEQMVGEHPNGAIIRSAGECIENLGDLSAGLNARRNFDQEIVGSWEEPIGANFRPDSDRTRTIWLIQSVLAWAHASGLDTGDILASVSDPAQDPFLTRCVAQRGTPVSVA